MPEQITEQMEPIPGYRLLERLGSGGFGEVWKSTAPGGLLKAIKFVHGALDEESGGAAQEFKSLQRVKALHHPFILSLERIDVVDDQLVIVMELADRNLMERFEECKKQRLPGIPREELLRYMAEAAEALDLMNSEYQIQHLDIKPQNLFLFRRHIKVADFGLAKDLEGAQATLSSGITPTYAAPETFESVVSQHCDQYSLAIVYQELLTGQRPFNGKNARQLLLQHISMPPNLDPLPEEDRPAVGRALAKKPLERYASCLEFVRALPRHALLPIDNSASANEAFTPSRWPVPKTSPESEPIKATVTPVRPDGDVPKTPIRRSTEGSTQHSKKRKKRSSALRIETSVCPRCGAPGPKGKALTFCTACGFAPNLEEMPEERARWQALLPLPPWYWVLPIGAVLIIAAAVAGHQVLPPESEGRAVWGLSEFVAGLLMLFIAQLWAVVLLSAEEVGIGIREVFLPTVRVWWQTARRLPVTRWPVYLSAWGLVAAVCGLSVGDLMYWSRQQTAQKTPSADARRAVAARADEVRQEERRTVELLEERTRRAPPPPATTAGKTEATVQCVAVGYVPSEDGSSIRGVLMAKVGSDGRLERTEVVEQGFSAKDRQDLLRRFQKIERTRPPAWWEGNVPKDVVWINAEAKSAVVCEVDFKEGVNKDGKPTPPRFKGVASEEP